MHMQSGAWYSISVWVSDYFWAHRKGISRSADLSDHKQSIYSRREWDHIIPCQIDRTDGCSSGRDPIIESHLDVGSYRASLQPAFHAKYLDHIYFLMLFFLKGLTRSWPPAQGSISLQSAVEILRIFETSGTHLVGLGIINLVTKPWKSELQPETLAQTNRTRSVLWAVI